MQLSAANHVHSMSWSHGSGSGSPGWSHGSGSGSPSMHIDKARPTQTLQFQQTSNQKGVSQHGATTCTSYGYEVPPNAYTRLFFFVCVWFGGSNSHKLHCIGLTRHELLCR